MTEIALAPQPYPDSRPWEDISAYLVPGVSQWSPFTCVALVDGNAIHYALRCIVDRNHPEINTRYLLRNLPARLRPGFLTTTTGWFTFFAEQTAYRVGINADGSISVSDWAAANLSLKNFTSFALTGIAVRSV